MKRSVHSSKPLVKSPCIVLELIAEAEEWTSDKIGDEYIYAKNPI